MTLPQWTPGPGYTPLSLKQIQEEFGCEIFGPPTAIGLYPSVLSFLPATTVIIDETTNRVVNFTYNFTNRNSRTIYWKLVNLTTSAIDYDGAVSGSLTADSGTFTITAKTDVTTEGPETFRIDLFLDPNGTSFYNSDSYTILDTSIDIAVTPTPTPTPTSSNTPTPTPTLTPTKPEVAPPTLGVNASYVGFGASTGGSNDEHWIHNFQFTSTLPQQSVNYNTFYNNSTLVNNATKSVAVS